VITLQSLSAHFSTGRDAQPSAVTDTSWLRARSCVPG
jgi:hypothetical protein